eukprot:11995892-Karenia_brevis.AAC.1
MELMQTTVMVLIAQLWRRMVWALKRWPWLLAIVADADRPWDERDAAGQLFLDANPCCGDDGFF